MKFQLLCTLGGIDSPASRAVQDRLLARNIEDPWMQIAALTASSDRAPALFKAAAAFTDQKTPATDQLLSPGRGSDRSAPKTRGDPRRAGNGRTLVQDRMRRGGAPPAWKD